MTVFKWKADQYRAVVNGAKWKGNEAKCKRDLEARGHTVTVYKTPVRAK